MSNHSSFFWQSLGKVYGGATDNETKENLFAYVWGQMRIHGEKNPPLLKRIEGSRFIKSRKARIIYSDMRKLDGYLNVTEKGFLIIVRQELEKSPFRLRTVVAHEIGHTFLFDIDSHPIKPYYSIGGSQAKQWKEHEGLAYDIGRNILIPKQILKNYLHLKPSIDSFLRLKSIFQTTSSVLARRLTHGDFWDAYIFLSKFDQRICDYQIPPVNCRFKSKISFKSFNLNLHWKKFKGILLEEESPNLSIKLGRKSYQFEAQHTGKSEWMICMLTPLERFKISRT